MKNEHIQVVETFNKRVEALFDQICSWLDEEQIKYKKEVSEITLTEHTDKTDTTKQLDILTLDNEKLFAIVPYGVRIIGAEGRVEIKGDSGEESFVYLSPTPETESKDSAGEKESILKKLNGFSEKGWHWVDDRITGKKPLLTKDIFKALLERIN